MAHLSFSGVIVFFLFVVSYMHASSKEENFLLVNGTTDEVMMALGPHINKRMSPCSTFKIPLSLMGYDAAILKDEVHPIWEFQEGYDDWLSFWRGSQSPLSWMKYSCVWYSKILSLELGLQKIQSYLVAIEYGSQDTSGGLAAPGPLDPFWINSSLQISPKEQVDFLQKILRNQLPFSPKAMQMTKVLIFKEELPGGWKLFGKTGWSGADVAKDGKTLEHGWFIGWIEKEDHFYPFAYLIREKKINLDHRIPRVKELLVGSKVMM